MSGGLWLTSPLKQYRYFISLNQIRDIPRMDTQGEFANSSFGGTERARASLMMFFLQGDIPLPSLHPPTSAIMPDDYTECPQLSGKTIKTRLHSKQGIPEWLKVSPIACMRSSTRRLCY